MTPTKPRRKAAPQLDVGTLLASLQSQLEETRRQLMEVMTRRDPKDLTVREVVDAYLRELPDPIDPERMIDRQRCLTGFAALCGEKRVSECGPLDLNTFLRSRPQWKSDWTNSGQLTHIRRCFNWARSVRLIREYPFPGVKAFEGQKRQAHVR